MVDYTSLQGNSGLGYKAMLNHSDGQYNVAIGHDAGYDSGLPDPESIESKKELLIFTVYINIDNLSNSSSRELLKFMSEQVKDVFNNVEEETNYLIKFFLYPVKNQETRMECIFPKNQDNIDLSSLSSEIWERKDSFSEHNKIEKELSLNNGEKFEEKFEENFPGIDEATKSDFEKFMNL